MALLSYSLYTLHPKWESSYLFATIPLVALGIFRYLFILYSSDMEDKNPSAIIVKDPILVSVVGIWFMMVVLIFIFMKLQKDQSRRIFISMQELFSVFQVRWCKPQEILPVNNIDPGRITLVIRVFLMWMVLPRFVWINVPFHLLNLMVVISYGQVLLQIMDE